MITLKRVRGNLIVTVDGEQIEFTNMLDALEFIYSVHSRRARTSL